MMETQRNGGNAFTPKKRSDSAGLPPRGSLSTPRSKNRGEGQTALSAGSGGGSGSGSGAPRKPPSHRKAGIDSIRGIAIDFEAAAAASASAAGDNSSKRRASVPGPGGATGTVRTSAWSNNAVTSKDDFSDDAFDRVVTATMAKTPEACKTRRHLAFADALTPATPVAPITPGGPDHDFGDMDSPDPCSKFHHGPGPVAISPMTPAAPEPSSNSSVDMDSPDPCSKFHGGMGPIPVSPLGWAKSSSTSMPVIYGSNVTVDSPDPCSKFNSNFAQTKPFFAQSAVTVQLKDKEQQPEKLSAAEAVIQKLWRHSASIEDKENVRLAKWKVSQPVSVNQPQPQTKLQTLTVAHVQSSSSSHRAHRNVVVSPDESLFSQTLSPAKPNYEAMCKVIQSGGGCAKINLKQNIHQQQQQQQASIDLSTESNVRGGRILRRKVSPQSGPEADLFHQTLSPYKSDYHDTCVQINGSSTNVNLDFGSSPLTKMVPVRPSAPPPRVAAEESGTIAAPARPFRRSFGKDITNVVSTNVVSPSSAEPTLYNSSTSSAPRKEFKSPSRGALRPREKLVVPPEEKEKENVLDLDLPSPTSDEVKTTSSASFRRGRTLKALANAEIEALGEASPPPTSPSAAADGAESPFSVIERFEAQAQVQSKALHAPQPKRPPAAKRNVAPTKVRVSNLVCTDDCSSDPKKSKRKRRQARYERSLESIDERSTALFTDFPAWLESVCSGGPLGSSGRRVVVHRAWD